MLQSASQDHALKRLSRFDIEVLASLDSADASRLPWDAGLVISVDHLLKLGLVERKSRPNGLEYLVTEKGRDVITLA